MSLSAVRRSWKLVYTILVPLLLLPLPLLIPTQEARAAYVILLMAAFWIAENIPLPATSLLPIALYPLLGIASTGEVCVQYMKETQVMIFGSIVIAIAISEWDLHRRIALNVIALLGPKPCRLLFGLLFTSMFLSMWTSNTAVAAMMVSIAETVIDELQYSCTASYPLQTVGVTAETLEKSDDPTEPCGSWTDPEVKRSPGNRLLRNTLLLSIAYGANIGGTGTLTGTPPNLVLMGLLSARYSQSPLSYGTWMIVNVPGMALCGLLAVLFLQIAYIRRVPTPTDEAIQAARATVKKKLDELGRIKFSEVAVIVLCVGLVLLWLMRDPGFMDGWAGQLTSDVKIGDATPAILVALLFFVIPSDPRRPGQSPPLLQWKAVQDGMPWGVLLFLGGGLGLALGAEKSGLATWVAVQLQFMGISNPIVMVSVLCLLTAMVTEVVSNTATASIFLPVVDKMAIASGVHPLYYLLPVTIAASFAFMLPVATAPNALVYATSRMKTLDMVRPGIGLNVLCCAVEVLMINTLGVAVFDLNTFPDWANVTAS